VQGVLTATADAVVNGVNVGRGGGDISSNTRVGSNALINNTTGTNNTAIGRDALRNNTTGIENTANGLEALLNNTTGTNNTAIGRGALSNNTTGNENTANGRSALLNNTTGGSNTANGRSALFSNTTGSNNTANGFESGRFIADGTTALTIANNSVFLGANTKALADNQTNQIVIGHTAIGLGSNTTVIGNSSTTFGRWFGNLLVGTSTNAGFALDVNGTARVQGNLNVSTGGITLTGNQTIQTSTGNLTLTSADNTGIVDIRRNDRALGAELRITNSFNGSGWLAGDVVGTLNFVSADISTTQPIRSQIQSINTVNATYPALSNLTFSTANFNTLTEGFRLTNTSNLLIGTTTDIASSKLTIESTTQGFLPPRMTGAQAEAIASPAEGLLLYATDGSGTIITSKGWWGFQGTTWNKLN
jgi:hypothetical protein